MGKQRASGGALFVARAQCEAVHLTIMMLVEKLRGEGQPAHATAIASQITGAPIAVVDETMLTMVREVHVLDLVIYRDEVIGSDRVRAYKVNSLGAEVLMHEVPGWEPSPLEQSLRDSLSASAQAGRMRS
jgi:hypothetical protein